MPAFNAAVPIHASLIASDELRDNFNALKELIDAIPTSGQSPGGAAGGDLGGNYPNPTVQSIANITTGPTMYPAGDGSQLTNVAAPPTLKSGVGNLDANVQLDLTGLTSAFTAVGAWYNTQGSGNVLTFGAPLRIASSAGSADAGFSVCWVAF